MAYIVQQSYLGTNGDAYQSVDGHYKFQTFIANSDYTLTKVLVRLQFTGTPVHVNYLVSIYSTDVGHLPSGPILAEMGIIDVWNISSTITNYEFYADSLDLISGIEYAIVLEPETPGEGVYFFWIGGTTNYASGTCGLKQYLGYSWELIAGASYRDRYFRTYSTVADTIFISGVVRDYSGIGIPDVTISLTGETDFTTLSDGVFSFSGLTSPFTGTLTATKTGKTFSPVNYSYSAITIDKVSQNFISNPEKATNPTPANASTDVSKNITTFTWEIP